MNSTLDAGKAVGIREYGGIRWEYGGEYGDTLHNLQLIPSAGEYGDGVDGALSGIQS
jgi:hypothetical protein